MASLTGTTIDKYEMLEEVGHGGMAVVYRGRDRVLDREVAVKVLHPHLADRQESRLRLQREAIAVAKLRHENILEIFDYSGPEAEESYIVTEFIHGPTLREWIERALPPRPAIAAMIVHRLCLALCHAHKGAIVHRDIKPENVMIRMEDGHIKLMDFGIAQIIDNQKLTLTGQLIGSPAYMAPELISGRPLDARTDLFSLGILLYQLSTSELPFNGRNPHEVLTRITDGRYPPPSSICPLVDRDFEAIIDRALALNPDDRYQSVDTFAKELEDYLGEMGVEPATSALYAYFTEPEAYVMKLDARVCATLVEQADKAGAAGSTARAIRLLGRVLELSPNHAGAKAMLSRFQARERRSRQLLFGAASLALVGLIAAGYMLMPPPSPATVAPAVANAPAYGGTHVADDAPADADGTESNEREATAAGPRDPIVPATESDATDDAPASSDAPGATGDDDSPKARAHVGVRGLAGKKPKTADTGPTPCTLTLSGVAVSQLSSLEVTAGGKRIDVTGSTVELEVPREGISVDVDHKRYEGRRRLMPHQCPATLLIHPKKAMLSFPGIPLETSVRCTEGCDGVASGNSLARAFPPVPMKDANGRAITLVFRHGEYDDFTKSVTVYPGPNPITVQLTQRKD